MAEQQVYTWTDPTDGEYYRVPVPSDSRVNIQDYLQSVVKTRRAQKAKYPTAQENGAPVGTPTAPALNAYDLAQNPTLATGLLASKIAPAAADFAIGAAKGAAETASGGYGMPVAGMPPLQNPTLTPQQTAPSNTAQSVGKGAERTAEFMTAGSGTGALTQGLTLPFRAAAQGATAYGVGRAQGQTPGEAAVTGGVAAAIPAVAEGVKYAVKKLALPQSLKNISPVNQIEQKIAPSGRNAQMMTKEIAPQLAADPKLAAATAGPQFDKALTSKFNASGEVVKAIESAIPDATEVDKQGAVDGLSALIKRYESIGADDAVRALQKQKSILQGLPEQVPAPQASGLYDASGRLIPAPATPPEKPLEWGQFIDIKRRLGNDLQKSGVWRRIANDTATERDYALSQAYGQFMEVANGVSEDLAKANKTFSMLHDAMHAAGLDDTGRRIALVGKGPLADAAREGAAPLTTAEKALQLGKKATIGALLGGGTAYGLYHYIFSPTPSR